MITKDFDSWNEVKKKTHMEKPRLYTVREIGKEYTRPCIIVRSFGPDACLVVPLTASLREHYLRVPIGIVNNKPARANISQIRVVDTRRLVRKLGFLGQEQFTELKKRVGELL